MGITNGYSLFKNKDKTHNEAVSVVRWSDLEGEEVFIDLSLDVHRYVLIKLQPSELYNKAPPNPTINDINDAYKSIVSSRIESCITGQVSRLRLAGVIPTYVLDGPPHPLKAATIIKRKNSINKKIDEFDAIANDVIYELSELDENTHDNTVIIVDKPLIDPMSVYVDELCNTPQKYLGDWAFVVAKAKLTDLGVKMIQAPHDAEGYASMLTNVLYDTKCNDHSDFHVQHFHHTVDDEIWCTCQKPIRPFGVLTSDSDVMAFGGRNIIRHTAKNVDEITVYNVDKLRDLLGVTRFQLVQICILMGCDFFKGISGLGPVKALDLIKKNKVPLIKQGIEYKHLHEVIPFYWEIVDLFTHK